MMRSPGVKSHVPLLVAFALTSGLNYAFGLIASRILSPGDFGVLAIAQALLLLGGLILQSGVPWSLARELVLADERGRGALFRGGLVANLCIAGGLAAIVSLLYAVGPLHQALEQPGILLTIVIALPLMAVAAVARAGAQALSRFGVLGAIQSSEVIGKVVVGLGLAAGGLGVLGAASGFAVGGLVAAWFGLAMVVPSARWRIRGSLRVPAVGSVVPMFAALLGLALVLNVDLIAVKVLVADRAAAGMYQAAIIVANAPYFLVSSALVPVLFSNLMGEPSLSQTKRRVGEGLRLAVALVLPIELLLIAVPDEVLRIFFPPFYVAAAPILRLMAVGNAVLIVVAVLGMAFQAVGRAGEVGRILLGVVAVELICLAVLVPRFGPIGAVSCFDGASCAAGLLVAWRYAREARVVVTPVAVWATRFVLAILAGLALALVWQSIGGVAAGIVAGGIAYYLLAVRLRLVHLPTT